MCCDSKTSKPYAHCYTAEGKNRQERRELQIYPSVVSNYFLALDRGTFHSRHKHLYTAVGIGKAS